MPKPTVETKFWSKVDTDHSSGCWLWLDAPTSTGYGLFGISGSRANPVRISAHRFAYELVVGPIPEGLQIDHLCRNRICVNPDHLEAVTQAENIRRGVSPAATRARQTHCRKGHKFTPENTGLSHGRWRLCRECDRQRSKETYAKRKQREVQG